jgi:hypothetical protein
MRTVMNGVQSCCETANELQFELLSLALRQRTPVGRLTDRRPASWFEIR